MFPQWEEEVREGNSLPASRESWGAAGLSGRVSWWLCTADLLLPVKSKCLPWGRNQQTLATHLASKSCGLVCYLQRTKKKGTPGEGAGLASGALGLLWEIRPVGLSERRGVAPERGRGPREGRGHQREGVWLPEGQ